jgi:hypothetical protein
VGARPDLDLSGLLSAFDRWLIPDREEPDDAPEADGVKFPEPVRLGWGPDRWSTSTELAPRIVFKWDVNGYYAALGVHPDANRRELREAYQARDGQGSAYLTYVFKQLLNAEVRAAYDDSPLGYPFLDDYQDEKLKRDASQEAGRRSRDGESVSKDDVLGEWGYILIDRESGVDSVSSKVEDRDRKAEPLRYSYYGWKTSSFMPNAETLQGWQVALASAAATLKVAPKLSFGITGLSDRSFILAEVDGQPVIFFPEGEEPTDSVAREAIEAFTKFPLNSPSSQNEVFK